MVSPPLSPPPPPPFVEREELPGLAPAGPADENSDVETCDLEQFWIQHMVRIVGDSGDAGTFVDSEEDDDGAPGGYWCIRCTPAYGPVHFFMHEKCGRARTKWLADTVAWYGKAIAAIM